LRSRLIQSTSPLLDLVEGASPCSAVNLDVHHEREVLNQLVRDGRIPRSVGWNRLSIRSTYLRSRMVEIMAGVGARAGRLPCSSNGLHDRSFGVAWRRLGKVLARLEP